MKFEADFPKKTKCMKNAKNFKVFITSPFPLAEKDQVRDIIRDEFSDRLVLLEDENSRYKREFSEFRARHKLEIENSKNEKENELKAVHERVKSAMARKDEAVEAIKRQLDMSEKRSKHVEELLEEQRKMLLKS